MEPKKNPKYDLHKKSTMIFYFSLAASILLVTTAFQWKTKAEITLEHKPEPLTNVDFYSPPVSTIDPSPVTKPRIIPLPDITRLVVDDSPENPAVQEPFIDTNQATDVPIITQVDMPIEPVITCVFKVVEQMPLPIGGYSNFYNVLSKNLKYPSKARRVNTMGKVYVQFIVNENGELIDFTILKGIGDGCDEEAIRVIALTKWNPGKQRGRPVKVRMVQPVTFSMNLN